MALQGPGPWVSTPSEAQKQGQEDGPLVCFPGELCITLVTDVSNGDVIRKSSSRSLSGGEQGSDDARASQSQFLFVF